MVKAVLFDLDNTLINFWEMKRKCIEAAVDAMIRSGLKMSKEKAIKKIDKIYSKYGIEEKHIFEKFLFSVNKEIDYRMLANAIVAYRKVRFTILEPYPFVKLTLSKLKSNGLKLAIVSDAPRLKCWIRLAYMGIDSLFDAVVSFDDSKQCKPGKLPFETVLKKLNCKPSEAVMVGDNIKRDILGAKKRGIATIFAKYGYVREMSGKLRQKSGADYEVDDIRKVIGIVKGL